MSFTMLSVLSNMPILVRVMLIALVAGVGGTVLGTVLGIIVKKPKKDYIACMLALAAGAMLGMALFEMLPEAYEHGDELFELGGLVTVIVGLVLGCLFVFLFSLLKRKTEAPDDDAVFDNKSFDGESSILGADACIIEKAEKRERKKLFGVGVAVFIAMALHGLPEGIAIGAGEHLGLGLVLGAVMLLHYIPEGVAFAVPFKASGMRRAKIILLGLAAGIPTIFGAVIGYVIGMNDALISFTLAFASAVMLYIVFAEMLPTVYKYSKKHHLTTLCVVAGVALIVVFSSFLH